MTRIKRWTVLAIPLLVSAAFITVDAHADRDHDHDRGHRDWHHDDHWRGGPPPAVYYGGPQAYAPPPAVYYGQPGGVSLNLNLR